MPSEIRLEETLSISGTGKPLTSIILSVSNEQDITEKIHVVDINSNGKWTFEELNKFLYKPKEYIKGTKMAFAGLKKEKDRASIILFMNQNSDNPLPLP